MRISDWSSDVCSSDLLEWIKAGCPAGVYDGEDYSHRISARALKSRGLVEIRGHRKTWIATITPRGELWPDATDEDERSDERRAGKEWGSVEPGGRRLIQKKKKTEQLSKNQTNN